MVSSCGVHVLSTRCLDGCVQKTQRTMVYSKELKDWYDKYYKMRDSLFHGTPDDVQSAREFYTTIVGDPAIVRLTVALKLAVTEGGQDWEIEVADPERVSEFLDYYENTPLDQDERHLLMKLIVASFDVYIGYEGANEQLAARVCRHLVESFDLHRWTVEYWARLERPDGFPITPLMREVWATCASRHRT